MKPASRRRQYTGYAERAKAHTYNCSSSRNQLMFNRQLAYEAKFVYIGEWGKHSDKGRVRSQRLSSYAITETNDLLL